MIAVAPGATHLSAHRNALRRKLIDRDHHLWMAHHVPRHHQRSDEIGCLVGRLAGNQSGAEEQQRRQACIIDTRMLVQFRRIVKLNMQLISRSNQ